MPVCKRCEKMQATAELRRSPKGGMLCRDTSACTIRARMNAHLQELTRLSEELKGGYR